MAETCKHIPHVHQSFLSQSQSEVIYSFEVDILFFFAFDSLIHQPHQEMVVGWFCVH